MRGAPIRFVAVVVGGWTCIRIAMLLPGDEPLTLAGDVLATPAAAVGRAAPFDPAAEPVGIAVAAANGSPGHRRQPAPQSIAASRPRTIAVLPPVRPPVVPHPVQAATIPILVVPTLGPISGRTPPRRWTASAWMLARGGAGGTLTGGKLGASQAGMRLTYALDTARRVALSGRMAAPLKGHGAEAAIGIDWQPAAAPIHLVAEQRFGIDGARGGPTALVIAGFAPVPVAAGFRLEGYAQGGAILRHGTPQAFGDGAMRLARPIATPGRATLDLGVGAWGAGQPGAARVDVGPTIGVALPVARRTIRLTLDWRQRVAGGARPGSGPALSIGSDF